MKPKFLATLATWGACTPGQKFAARFSTATEAWQECNDIGWLLWVLTHAGQWHTLLDFLAEVVAANAGPGGYRSSGCNWYVGRVFYYFRRAEAERNPQRAEDILMVSYICNDAVKDLTDLHPELGPMLLGWLHEAWEPKEDS